MLELVAGQGSSWKKDSINLLWRLHWGNYEFTEYALKNWDGKMWTLTPRMYATVLATSITASLDGTAWDRTLNFWSNDWSLNHTATLLPFKHVHVTKISGIFRGSHPWIAKRVLPGVELWTFDPTNGVLTIRPLYSLLNLFMRCVTSFQLVIFIPAPHLLIS